MKNTFKIFIAFIMITGLWSCESEDNFKIATPQEASFMIITPDTGAQILITPTTPAANTGLTMTWEDVDYGTPTDVKYTIESALNGTEFAAPHVEALNLLDTHHSFTYTELNDMAKYYYGDELPDAGEETPLTIDLRIKSTIGTAGGEEKYSDVITIVVTPFVLPDLEMKELYLVGPASSSGWNNNLNNTPMFRDADNKDLFVLTAKFNAGEFKLLEHRAAWQPQWGQNGGELAVNTGSGTDPGAFMIPSDGYYTVTVNIDDNTFSIVPFDASGAATYATIGFIGAGRTGNEDTGWTADDDMAASAMNPHLWQISNPSLHAGFGVKFRANDGWDINWGSGTPLSGIATMGGSNVPVEDDGAYEIWFNDIDGRYMLIPAE